MNALEKKQAFIAAIEALLQESYSTENNFVDCSLQEIGEHFEAIENTNVGAEFEAGAGTDENRDRARNLFCAAILMADELNEPELFQKPLLAIRAEALPKDEETLMTLRTMLKFGIDPPVEARTQEEVSQQDPLFQKPEGFEASENHEPTHPRIEPKPIPAAAPILPELVSATELVSADDFWDGKPEPEPVEEAFLEVVTAPNYQSPLAREIHILLNQFEKHKAKFEAHSPNYFPKMLAQHSCLLIESESLHLISPIVDSLWPYRKIIRDRLLDPSKSKPVLRKKIKAEINSLLIETDCPFQTSFPYGPITQAVRYFAHAESRSKYRPTLLEQGALLLVLQLEAMKELEFSTRIPTFILAERMAFVRLATQLIYLQKIKNHVFLLEDHWNPSLVQELDVSRGQILPTLTLWRERLGAPVMGEVA